MPSSQPSAAMQDVLSSIRRLVSEDLRTEPRKGGDAAAGRDAAAPAGEKLVLTDALRVAEPLGTTARHDAPDDVAHHVATEVPPGRAAMTGRDEPGQATAGADAGKESSAPSLEDTIAELEAAVAGTGEDFEPDGSEMKDDDHRMGDDGETVPEFSFAVDDAEDEAAQPPGETSVEVPQDPALQGDILAHAEGAASATDDWHEDAAPPDDGQGRENAPASGPEPAGTRRQGIVRRLTFAADEEGALPSGDDGEQARPSNAAGDRDENLGQAAQGGAVPYARTLREMVDTDAFREMVAQVIREELQGTLGERITRNVRKLVRREINRALDIEDGPDAHS
ncbi:MAG: hypothetical protein H6901_05450 [Rhodobacteraceae bacterium]|nr:hypothetical protein [Paracoccaceae bacterium]MCP5341639.1 hypothetical protein [Paracoccaceae bacterium]